MDPGPVQILFSSLKIETKDSLDDFVISRNSLHSHALWDLQKQDLDVHRFHGKFLSRIPGQLLEYSSISDCIP